MFAFFEDHQSYRFKPYPNTSFILVYLYKDSAFILRYWGLGLAHELLGEHNSTHKLSSKNNKMIPNKDADNEILMAELL